MVIKCSNVVGATGGIVGVVGGAAEIALGVGTGGATMGETPDDVE